MTQLYYRPLVQCGPKPPDALVLAGGWAWFDRVEVISRDGPAAFLAASDLPEAARAALTRERAPMAGLSFDWPRILGILNVTPDSFSDGGQFNQLDVAVERAKALMAAGADALDIGGESTRPGAETVEIEEELARVAPVVEQLAAIGVGPLSIDTRKARVADITLKLGADLINDVSAMGYDPDMVRMLADTDAPVCLMHAQGAPATMQDDPQYRDVILDVYDELAEQIERACAAGIAKSRIMVDPGIGFGKKLEHNLALLQRLSLFHGVGCPIMLGASRKRFIGTLAEVETASDRVSGSVAVALAGLAQGIQVVRVHDVAETAQAVKLWTAAHGMRQSV